MKVFFIENFFVCGDNDEYDGNTDYIERDLSDDEVRELCAITEIKMDYNGQLDLPNAYINKKNQDRDAQKAYKEIYFFDMSDYPLICEKAEQARATIQDDYEKLVRDYQERDACLFVHYSSRHMDK